MATDVFGFNKNECGRKRRSSSSGGSYRGGASMCSASARGRSPAVCSLRSQTAAAPRSGSAHSGAPSFRPPEEMLHPIDGLASLAHKYRYGCFLRIILAYSCSTRLEESNKVYFMVKIKNLIFVIFRQKGPPFGFSNFKHP